MTAREYVLKCNSCKMNIYWDIYNNSVILIDNRTVQIVIIIIIMRILYETSNDRKSLTATEDMQGRIVNAL